MKIARYPTLADLIDVTTMTEGGCLIWQRARDSGGYGSLRSKSKTYRAHEVAWFLSGRERPQGYTLHHTCGNRDCVQVAHMVCLTRAEHWEITKAEDRFFEVKRTLALQRQLCKRGHNDWYVKPSGGRQCRECQRQWTRENSRRLKEKGVN